jgi:hypothetical protein
MAGVARGDELVLEECQVRAALAISKFIEPSNVEIDLLGFGIVSFAEYLSVGSHLHQDSAAINR